MKSKIIHYFKEIITFFVILAILTNVVSFYKSLDLNKQNLTISEFKLIDNTTYKLSSNKAIIVHFWATWCPVCKVEASNIDKLSDDFEVITVAVDSGNDQNIENYLYQNGVSFLVVNDKNRVLAKKFNVLVYPTTLIFNKDGKLIFSEVGYSSVIGLYLKSLIASYL